MIDIGDHPVIRNLMETGRPDGRYGDRECPSCGAEITSRTMVCKDDFGEIIGCEYCSRWEMAGECVD